MSNRQEKLAPEITKNYAALIKGTTETGRESVKRDR